MRLQDTAEYQRITGDQREQWHDWGCYISNRSWGTFRENYAKTDKAWDYLPFNYSHSRAYRWSEDGIGGFCDRQQRLCLALAFWNEHDPILKERFFGLTNEQSNHGETVKDYYFYLDAVASGSYMKMLYKYPQTEFPYARIVREGALRSPEDPSLTLFEVLPNTFTQGRYFDIFIEYAKADVDDLLCRVTAINRGQEAAPLHILPHLWYRNIWSFDGRRKRPELRAVGENSVQASHSELGDWYWYIETCDDLLFTENESNRSLLADEPNISPYVKDGIHAAVIYQQKGRINPEKYGTKCAAHYRLTLAPGETRQVNLRLRSAASQKPFADFEEVFEQRQKEADEFYAALQNNNVSAEEKSIQHAAFAGLLWNRSFYHFNIKAWLKGDAQEDGCIDDKDSEYKQWQHLDAHDIISIPDIWEYPFLALWDIDFQLVTLALVDPQFAQQQILLFLSDRYMRSDGAMPAFDGDLSTPHPPLHAWAAWHIYQTTGKDADFLALAYAGLKRHYDWWLKEQQHRDYLFGGGFLGMDNISVLDRNEKLSEESWLAQADGTGWMAFFALHLLAMAVESGQEDDALRFLEDFAAIRQALTKLWDDESHFFYDVLFMSQGKQQSLKIRSLVGLVPLVGVLLLDPDRLDALPRLKQTLEEQYGEFRSEVNECYLLTAASRQQIGHLIAAVFDPGEFYSPHGVRSLSKFHESQPFTCEIEGETHTLTYEPGESSDNMFGGNSNWRGPIWPPLNQLTIEALHYYHAAWGKSLKLPDGTTFDFEKAAADLASRLVSLFKMDEQGWRRYFGENEFFQTNPHWKQYLWFYEYFHAETGAGLGTSHQNGWTALVAKLIQNQGKEVFIPGDAPVAETAQ